MARLPEITKKEQVPASGHPAVDAIVKSRGGIHGPFNVFLHSPEIAGLFSVNSKVRRQDVADGLSNTLAAGEIADQLPAWGDPENWRTVGKGINRDAQGFG